MAIKRQNLSVLMMRNSSYALLTNLILKLGGLIFTLIIARILLPELFGIYALVLSVTTLAITFTDIGLNNTLLRYFSESFEKGDKAKSKAYLKYILKIKLSLIFVIVITLAFCSKSIAYLIYNKPLLFYPLLFSCLFVVIESLWSLCSTFFIASNFLKPWPILNLFLQIFKISFSVLAVLLLSDSLKVTGIFISFFISGAIILLLAVLIIYKKNKWIRDIKPKVTDLSRVNIYWRFMVLSSLSLALFTSIDTLMLGGAVSSEYIGYYRASSSIIWTLAAMLSLSSIFLPVFTQISGKRFERGLRKTLRTLLIISVPITGGLIFFARHIIFFIYGDNYLTGVLSMYSLSLLIITSPLIDLYSTILQSREKSKIVGKSILFSLIFNIILNLVVIFLFKLNSDRLIIGIGLVTSLSRLLLLGILIFYSRKLFNLKPNSIGIFKIIFSTFLMIIFLILYDFIIDINLIFGLFGIFLGIGMYLFIMFYLKGINKEDFILLNNLINIKKYNKNEKKNNKN